MIETYTIIGDPTTGGAGVSASTTIDPKMIIGRVLGIGVVYIGSPPGTTDVTIRTANKNHALPDVTLLTLTSVATDVWRQPFVLKDDTAGADIAGQYVEPVIADQVEVVVAQANDGDSVNVILVVDR